MEMNRKTCQRCGGRLMIENWPGAQEIVCLQCGRRSYPEAKTSIATA